MHATYIDYLQLYSFFSLRALKTATYRFYDPIN